MTNRHFVLTDETITHEGVTLYRIRATHDLLYHAVAAGDLGGFVQHEKNLSEDAWVGDDAMVLGHAEVLGRALINGKAIVSDGAVVSGSAVVTDNARVYGLAYIYEEAQVCDNAHVYGEASMRGLALAAGNSRIFDYAFMSGNSAVFDNARIFGHAGILTAVQIFDDASISGAVRLAGAGRFRGNAQISEHTHVATGTTIFTYGEDWWTLYLNSDGTMSGCIGHWTGTPDELAALAASDEWPFRPRRSTKAYEAARPELMLLAEMWKARQMAVSASLAEVSNDSDK